MLIFNHFNILRIIWLKYILNILAVKTVRAGWMVRDVRPPALHKSSGKITVVFGQYNTVL